MRPGRLLAGIFYRLRRLPSLFGRFRFWLYLIAFALLLAVLSPFVGVLSNLLSAVGRILGPILESRIGRTAAGILLLVLVAWFLYRRFRARGRQLLGAFALDRYLAGMLHLSAGRTRRAAALFRRVIRTGRLTDLSRTVEVFPEIVADARIKLALCYRELGNVERAMEQLELLKVKELPPAVRRDLSEAKALVYSLSRELMDETIDREIDRALEADPSNRRLLRLRRERAERTGDLDGAITAQKAVLKYAVPAAREVERQRLAMLHVRNALRLRRLCRDDEAAAEAERARAAAPELVLPGLVAGDIAAERGDARAAVRDWARVPSLAGFERVRALLLSGGLHGAGDLSFLVAELPRAGVLLLLAEYWLAGGKLRKARNCLRKLEEIGAADRHSDRLLSEVLRREGDEEGARKALWRALRGFLGAAPPGTRREPGVRGETP